MTTPFTHRDAPTAIGSWPIFPTLAGGGTPTIVPRTLDDRATILSMRREPSGGFDVDGRSLFLWVDVATVPTQISISFVGPNLTLNDVITQINSQASPTAGADVAFADNGFLRLRSPNAGEDSYLRLQTDPASSPTDVFFELGLFSETIALGGQITQAQHIDPDRQVAAAGQLSSPEGESFSSSVFNRIAFQLAINSDRAGNLLDEKRIAIRKEFSTTYTPTSPDGIAINDTVFAGTTVTPSVAELEVLVAILDADGNELTKEVETDLDTGLSLDFTYESETGRQLVTATVGNPFVAADVTEDRYVKPTDLTGGPSALNGVNLKIVGFISTTQVVIQPINPATGALVQITEAGRTGDRVEISTLKVQADGIYDTAGGSRIEAVNTQKEAPIAISRVEKNNRFVCVGAQFVTNDVIRGDLVTVTGHVVTSPFSNNGNFRVLQVVDEETLEVVCDDWSSAILNPSLSGGAGTLEVTTDGAFVEDPFIRFDAAGGIPDNGETIRVLYMGMSNFREATDDPSLFVGPGVKYKQEADDTVQQALLAIMGPSTSSITDFIKGDRNVNLEQLDTRLDKEHHDDTGRHSDIEPDTAIFRQRAPEIDDFIKLAVYDGANDLMGISNRGYIGVGVSASDANNAGVGYPREAFEFGFEESAGSPMELFGTQTPGLTADFDGDAGGFGSVTLTYAVTAIDAQGNESDPTMQDSIAIDGVTENNVTISWSPIIGAVGYIIYRGVDSAIDERYVINAPVDSYVDADKDTFSAASLPAAGDRTAFAIKFSNNVPSWIGGSLCVGGAPNTALLNVNATPGDAELFTYSRYSGDEQLDAGLSAGGAGKLSPVVRGFMGTGPGNTSGDKHYEVLFQTLDNVNTQSYVDRGLFDFVWDEDFPYAQFRFGDDSPIFWLDVLNSRLGVNVEPLTRLHVSGFGTNGGLARFESTSAANGIEIIGVDGASVDDSAFVQFDDGSNIAYMSLVGTNAAAGGNAGDVRVVAGGSERLRVDRVTGAVGIRETTPDALLEVRDSATPLEALLKLSMDDSFGTLFGLSITNADNNDAIANGLNFWVTNAGRGRIDSADDDLDLNPLSNNDIIFYGSHEPDLDAQRHNGTAGRRWTEVHAVRGFFDGNNTVPGSQGDLVMRHGRNNILACGVLTFPGGGGAPSVASGAWNIASATAPAAGTVNITLDQAVSTTDATIIATMGQGSGGGAKYLPYANQISSTLIQIQLLRPDGSAAFEITPVAPTVNNRLHFTIIGSPSSL